MCARLCLWDSTWSGRGFSDLYLHDDHQICSTLTHNNQSLPPICWQPLPFDNNTNFMTWGPYNDSASSSTETSIYTWYWDRVSYEDATATAPLLLMRLIVLIWVQLVVIIIGEAIDGCCNNKRKKVLPSLRCFYLINVCFGIAAGK
jgi:hypothetical protein